MSEDLYASLARGSREAVRRARAAFGGTRKIADLPYKHMCRHPEHSPPSMMSFEDGVYAHTCPSCGGTQTFIVRSPSL